MSEALIYEWTEVAGLRLPLHRPLTLVPLRPLAAELGLGYACLVSAAGRLPVGRVSESCPAYIDGMAKPRHSMWIEAEDVGTLGLLARPRSVTPALARLRAAHHQVARAFATTTTGAEFVGRRYGAGNTLDEAKMLQIVALTQAGKTPADIAAELGKSVSVIRKFLLGLYPTAAARAFYKQHGKPTPASPGSLCAGQESP